jgi:HEAT repeat protein
MVRESAATVVKQVGSAAATPAILRRLAGMLASEEQEKYSAALDAIRSLGAAAATPEFLSGLSGLLSCRDGRAWVRGVQAAQLLGRSCGTPPILSALASLLHRQGEDLSKDTYTHGLTAEAVAVLGEAAAIPEIFTGMAKVLVERDDYCGHVAAEWIEAVHRGGLVETIRARLAEMLRDRDDHVRSAAAEATGTICAVTRMPEMQLYLQGSFADLPRHAAAQTIAAFANSMATPALLGSLVSMLGSTNENLTRSARQVIRRIALVSAASDVEAHIAVVNQGATESESPRRLAEGLHQGDTSQQLFALRELEKIGPTAATPEVLNGLCRVLRSHDPGLQVASLRVAESLGSTAATPELLALVWCLRYFADTRIHWAARYALASMLHKLDLRALLDDAVVGLQEGSDLAHVLFQALADYCAPMYDLGPHWTRLLCHEEPSVRRAVAASVEHLRDPVTISAVRMTAWQLLGSGDSALQKTAYAVFIGECVRAYDAQPEWALSLIRTICDTENPLRRDAIQVLAQSRLCRTTPEVTCAVKQMLSSGAPDVRQAGLSLLGKGNMHETEVECLDILVRLLSHIDAETRSEAARAVSRIGSAAATSDVLAALCNLLHDQDESVRDKAGSAIAQMGHRAVRDDILDRLIEASAWETLLGLWYFCRNPVILERVAQLLNAVDAEIRRSAAQCLFRMTIESGSDELLSRCLFLFEARDCRAAGISGLDLNVSGGMAATPVRLGLLATLARGSNLDLQLRALREIGKIGQAAATPAIVTSLEAAIWEDEVQVVREAIRALRNMGIATATESIAERLLLCMSKGTRLMGDASRALLAMMARGARVFQRRGGGCAVRTVEDLSSLKFPTMGSCR